MTKAHGGDIRSKPEPNGKAIICMSKNSKVHSSSSHRDFGFPFLLTHLSDGHDENPGVQSQSLDHHVGQVAAKKASNSAADEGGEGDGEAGVEAGVVLLEVELRVVGPRGPGGLPEGAAGEEEEHGGRPDRLGRPAKSRLERDIRNGARFTLDVSNGK